MSAQYIYKITYPNGKIYVGQDETESYATYFGSGVRDYIERDFYLERTPDPYSGNKIRWQDAETLSAPCSEFIIKKEILWSSESVFSAKELKQKKDEFIVKFEANNPEKGYNLIPKYDKE